MVLSGRLSAGFVPPTHSDNRTPLPPPPPKKKKKVTLPLNKSRDPGFGPKRCPTKALRLRTELQVLEEAYEAIKAATREATWCKWFIGLEGFRV